MKYDSFFSVPAPALEIIVRQRKRSPRFILLRARLDTGADITVIPFSMVNSLRLEAGDSIAVSGYDGSPTEIQTYVVTLEIVGHSFENIKVVASQRAEILIGLDILNHFFITLDGPAQDFEMTIPK